MTALFAYLPAVAEENYKTLRITGFRVDIWTRDLPNTKQNATLGNFRHTPIPLYVSFTPPVSGNRIAPFITFRSAQTTHALSSSASGPTCQSLTLGSREGPSAGVGRCTYTIKIVCTQELYLFVARKYSRLTTILNRNFGESQCNHKQIVMMTTI
jgi:hypothetical protein